MDSYESLVVIVIVSSIAVLLCAAVVRADILVRASATTSTTRLGRALGDAVMPMAFVGIVATLLGVLSAFELLVAA